VGLSPCGSEAEDAAFLRPTLRPGTRLVAVAGKFKGDGGMCLKDADDNSQPSIYSTPCEVQWDKAGTSCWVSWRDVALEVRTHRLPRTDGNARGDVRACRGAAMRGGWADGAGPS
jgi:hypothetical protein